MTCATDVDHIESKHWCYSSRAFKSLTFIVSYSADFYITMTDVLRELNVSVVCLSPAMDSNP